MMMTRRRRRRFRLLLLLLLFFLPFLGEFITVIVVSWTHLEYG